MRDQQSVIDSLKARCHVYKVERLTLLKVIRDLSDMLYDKFRTEDQADVKTDQDLDRRHGG